MIPQIVLLSGPIGSGKTTLGESLASRYRLRHFKSSDYLIAHGTRRGIPKERGALQKFGESLDRQTKGRWVVDGLRVQFERGGLQQPIVLDAMRIQKQIDAVRDAYGQK